MKIAIVGVASESLIKLRFPLIAELCARNYEVTCCAAGEAPEVATTLTKVGAKYVALDLDRDSINPVSELGKLLSITVKLRSIKPDVVLTYSAKAVIYGSIAAVLAGVPHRFSIISGLGYVFAANDAKARLLRTVLQPLYAFSLRNYKAVFFQNQDNFALFRQLGLLSKATEPQITKGSGVDLEQFQAAPAILEPIRFLLMARLIKEKGIYEYIEAARLLKTPYPEARFQLLGPFDKHPHALKPSEVERWNAEGLIEYLGATKDVRPYLAQASVYVQPSHSYEGLPHSVLEAMAAARPIVTTNTPGCKETVIKGENGFLVPQQDATALSQAMEKFIVNPQLISTMGQRSRELAEQQFSVQQVNHIIISTIERKIQKAS